MNLHLPSASKLALGAALLGGGLIAPLAAGCSTTDVSPPLDAGADTSLPLEASAPDARPDTNPPPDAADASDAGPDVETPDAACTGADLAARWAAMDLAPIAPPNHYANLDLAGPTATGLTLAEAQAINCAGTIITDDAGGPPGVTWGSKGEVTMYYDAVSLVAVTMDIAKAPPLTFKSRDTKHTYVIALGQAVTKDGAAFPIDWTTQQTADPAVTELDDAVRSTFAPSLPVDADCLSGVAPKQNCLVEINDSAGASNLGFRGTDASGTFHLGLYVAFKQGTNVADHFYAVPVLGEADAGADGGH